MKVVFLIIMSISWLYSYDIVRDNKTGLIWQDNSDSKYLEMSWKEARNYCQDLVFAGKNNWRLPEIKELQTIVDIKRYDPAIKDSFKNVESYGYWSASNSSIDDERAWEVHFEDGATGNYYKSYYAHVRCVRKKTQH